MRTFAYGFAFVGLTLSSTVLARASVFEVPSSLKTKYSALYKVPVVQNSDGSRGFGPARHWNRRGVHVLYLVGDRFEMGFQHGRLMQKEVRDGALVDAANGLGNAVKEVMGNNFISRIAANFMYRSITEKMYKFSTENPVVENVDPLLDGYGLSEGSGVDFKTILYAALSAESMTVLLGKNLAGNTFGIGGGDSNQCSSFAAWGNATADGEVVIGRNTDYWLNGSYDRFPTVIYYNPTDGTQKYMAVTSAGLHNAGVVGMNEAGIYIDVHTIPTKDTSAEGIPVFMLAQEVLRGAKTFEEALAKFQIAKPGAGWTYVLVSTKEKKAATIDLSNSGIGIRHITGDTLVQTNHFLTQAMQSRYERVNSSTDNDTRARYRRISEMVTAKRGSLGVKDAAAILADKIDPFTGQTRWLGNTVAVHTTMTSAVVDAGRDRIFVGAGLAPVSQTEFVEFPIVHIDPATFASSQFQTFANDAFKVQNPAMAEAEQYYIKAKIAYEKYLNIPQTIGYLDQALAKDPTSVGVQFMLGILNVRVKDYARAAAHLTKLTQSSDVHYKFLGHYFLGRIYAATGQKQAAFAQFDYVVDNAPPTEDLLIEAADKASKQLSWRFRLRFGLLDLPLMFQQADMINYK